VSETGQPEKLTTAAATTPLLSYAAPTPLPHRIKDAPGDALRAGPITQVQLSNETSATNAQPDGQGVRHLAKDALIRDDAAGSFILIPPARFEKYVGHLATTHELMTNALCHGDNPIVRAPSGDLAASRPGARNDD
jgi:hypothetical protein